MKYPISCDTFVVLPGCGKNNAVIFGKNSDRPDDEVQDIVYIPAGSHPQNSKVKCTYIEIEQVPETYAVVLSKPNWMWGAEMGGNSYGVSIGNEAIWAIVKPEQQKKLLGMDFVRLGLERGKSAREALEVITNLLEVHGQGGPCSNTQDLTYHNSYLIADFKEAWVLETVGKYWAAENVTSGFRNISNCLSIQGQVDLMSCGLKAYAEKLFNWDPSTEFNFAAIFSGGSHVETLPEIFHPNTRFETGRRLLCEYTKHNNFDMRGMMSVLRDGGINMGGYGAVFATASSQVSVLKESGACHWFTGTPDSAHSVFKPFAFLNDPGNLSTNLTISSEPKIFDGEYKHELYGIHEKLYGHIKKNKQIQDKMKALEERLISKYSTVDVRNMHDSNMFNDAVAAEIQIYIEAYSK